jgi:predicted transposase YbfD/YdcC
MDDNAGLAIAFSALLQDVPDPRAGANVRHPLLNILTIALCAMLSGYESFEEMEYYGHDHFNFLKTFLRMKHGVPSHDTFKRVFEVLDKNAFQEALANLALILAESIRLDRSKAQPPDRRCCRYEHYSIDGKALRGSLSRHDQRGVHMVNVYSSQSGMCIRTLPSQGKGHELETTREILGKLNLKGIVVSLDALSCQKDIASYIASKKGFFLLAVKDNQVGLKRDIVNAFSAGKVPQIHAETSEQTREKIETRRLEVIDDLSTCMETGWVGVRQIMRIDRTVKHKKTGVETKEIAYGITNLTCDQSSPMELLTYVREHWEVENKLHRTLDVMFHEDGCQVRERNAAANLATLRRMCLNILKAMPTCSIGTTRIKNKRRSCANHIGYIAKALSKCVLRSNA